MLTLLEELWLLALNEKSGKLRTTNLAQALTGAALIELAFDRRINTKGKREVGVLNSKPLNHPVLDAALKKIQSADNYREVRRWMFDLASLNQKMIYDFVAVGLVEQGIIEAQTQSLLGGLIKRKRWVLRNSEVRNEIITRMRETAFENKEATIKKHLPDAAGRTKRYYSSHLHSGRAATISNPHA